jgi:hypothetical protein
MWRDHNHNQLRDKGLSANWISGMLLPTTWNGGKTHVTFATSRQDSFGNNLWREIFLTIALGRVLHL